jgi:hypothetical protein
MTKKRFILLGWRVALLLWITLTLWPVTYGITRLLQAVLLVGLWIGMIVIWWHKRWVGWSLLSSIGLCAVFLLLPGREFASAQLRVRYVKELQSYSGVRYVWGGENCFGIDCSGLVRRAAFQTLWKQSLLTLNPGLSREAIEFWWHDASARALAGEHRNQTMRLLESSSIIDLDSSRLLPGDLAVTSDGVHVLAYLGGGEWIEADPDVGRVVSIQAGKGSSDANSWLRVPVTILRWRFLAD